MGRICSLSDGLVAKCNKRDSKVKKLLFLLERTLCGLDMNNRALDEKYQSQLKNNENSTLYQHKKSAVNCDYNLDRHFPLETIAIKTFNMDYDTKIEYVNLHTGPFANEYARSMNALAVTSATNIYFKDGEYKPETEQGRKLLAHELTHISQYEEGRITPNTTKDELEIEALVTEKYQLADYDPVIIVEISGHDFRIRKSEIQEVIDMAVSKTIRWFEKQKLILNDDEYDKLLSTHKRLIKEKWY